VEAGNGYRWKDATGKDVSGLWLSLKASMEANTDVNNSIKWIIDFVKGKYKREKVILLLA
jgi:hypothetical protein